MDKKRFSQLIEQLKQTPKPVVVVVGAVVLVLLIGYLLGLRKPQETTDTRDNPYDIGEDEGLIIPEEDIVSPETIRREEEFRFIFYSPQELESLNNAVQTKQKLLGDLPVFISQYETSVGLKTDISIFALDDVPHAIHLEINGINHMIMAEGTPELIAFEESMTEALRIISETGADPNQVNYMFHNIPYYHETIASWVNRLDLL